jgi:uncharacterized protein (TIGR03437 family)
MRRILLKKSIILLAWLPLWFAAEQPLLAQNIQMTGWSELLADGGAVSWSSNNVIAYDHIGAPGQTGYFNLYTINPNGTSQTCLTCSGAPGASGLPGLNNGAPVWTPDAKFIIFQVQAGPSLGNFVLDFPGFPGEGAGNDLWATDTLGNFWQLTNQATYSKFVAVGGSYSSGGTSCGATTPQNVTFIGGGATTAATGTIALSGGVPTGAITMTGNGAGDTSAPTQVQVANCTGQTTITGAELSGMGGVIYPTFSWDGTKLAWGQRLVPDIPGANPNAGTAVWELAVATFSESGGVPSLSDIQYYSPGTSATPYYEPRSFSLDNSTVFFMGNVTPGGNVFVRNIYSFNLGTQVLLNLTKTTVNWNEYPVALPARYGSNKIIYMMYPLVGAINPHCVADYWVMNYDGTDNYQLTFFNTPSSPNYVPAGPDSPNRTPGGACMDTHSWSPDGNQLVIYNNVFAAHGQSGPQGPIWILDIAPANATVNAASYQSPPLAADAIVSIFGTNLANQTLAAPSAALPTNLGNTTVSVMDAKGVARPASLYFVSRGQINLVIPVGTGPGPAVVTVTNPEGVQSSSTVNIASVSPGFYTMNQNGQGVVAAYVQVVPASGPPTDEPVYSCPGGGAPCTTIPIDVSNPSDQFYLVMFGTGFRGRSSLQGVSVAIGNRSVPVIYAGEQGQYEGFDQMNVQLPNSLAGAGVVNIVATVDGVTSNVVQIQVQ